MIIVNIMGGLGNQMFQYAAAKHLSLIADTELKINSLDFIRCTANKDHTFQLGNFNISASQADKKEICKFKNSRRYRLLNFLKKNFALSVNSSDLINYYLEEAGSCYKADILSLGPENYLFGYFNSYKYFDSIRDIILNEYTPKWEVSPLAQETIQSIHNSNSVGIHLRRGDYVTNPQVKAGLEGIITHAYYDNAVNYILKHIDSPHFFIFSNDIKWVKDKFTVPAQVTYVDFNSAQRGFEDLWIMSRCKHNITAGGSTFSWWAAYLNSNKEKIVITTEKVNNDALYNHPADYFPPTWRSVPS